MATRIRPHALAAALALALAAAPAAASDARVYDRAAIERSGAFTLAEFLRGLPQDSFGTLRPSAYSNDLTLVSGGLHGLGSQRTLVLVDGRPLPLSAAGGREQNLATIPLALVERIEVRPDGAGAGTHPMATLGSINIVLRRPTEGAIVAVGAALPESSGADRWAASALTGGGDGQSSWSLGLAHEDLDAVAAGDRPWIPAGASTLSNNFGTQPFSSFLRHPTQGSVPPGGCTGAHFAIVGTGPSSRCTYDFNALADSEPALRSDALAFDARHALENGWLVQLDTRVAEVTGEVTLAPGTATEIPIPVGTPNHPAVRFPALGYAPDQALILRHRAVAVGPRSVRDEESQFDGALGLSGQALGADLTLQARHAQSRGDTLLRNHLALEAFHRAVSDGRFDIYNPGANSQALLDEIAPDFRRKTRWSTSELLAGAQWALADLAGGSAVLRTNAEFRRESWDDSGDDPRLRLAPPRPEDRDVERRQAALGLKADLPFAAGWLAQLGVRHDDYDTSGGETSAQWAVEWSPDAAWRLRASHGIGFVAPSLALVDFASQAEQTNLSIPSWCLMGAILPGYCRPGTKLSLGAVPGLLVANPELDPERTSQSRIGLGWRPDPRFELTLDLWDSRVEDRIVFLSPDVVVACAFGAISDCPAGIRLFSNTAPAAQRVGLGAQPIGGDPDNPWVQYGWSNRGEIGASGVDLGLRWHQETASGKLDSELLLGWLARHELDGVDTLDGRQDFGEAWGPRPRSQARLDTRWEGGDWSFAWQAIHTGSTRLEDFGSGLDEFVRLPSWTTHDVQARWRTPWEGIVVVGVRNLFDREPPIDPLQSTGSDYAFALYDGSGRTPYLQYRQSW